MQEFFYEFAKNIFRSFRGKNFIAHLLAIVTTIVIVISGFDWYYFTSINGSSISQFLWPAIALGGLVPIFFPITLFVIGQIRKSAVLMNTGYALAQSAFLGLLISSSYKSFTGRIPPMRHMIEVAQDVSHQFQFGFMRGGVFWGWPSSHTTVAFATMVTLVCLYPKRRKLTAIALAYAFYVGIGVTVGIHWFSEFIAGALIGIAIGMTVGKSFYERTRKLSL